jgi:hypothetical protein
MLAKTLTEAARFVAESGVINEGAPILLRFVTRIATRFRIGGDPEGSEAGASGRRASLADPLAQTRDHFRPANYSSSVNPTRKVT